MMADKEHRASYPLAPANGHARSDYEAAVTANSEELRRTKRKKCIIYVIAFIIFQVGVITIFSVTVMKVKNPKFQVRSASYQPFGNSNSQTNTSINLPLTVQFGVKNTNFGPFKFDSTTVDFYYRGVQVGSASIPQSKASFKSTKKIDVLVDLALQGTQLQSDLKSGILPLTSKGQLSGKVELMLIMKKKKVVNLSCSMDLNPSSTEVQNLVC